MRLLFWVLFVVLIAQQIKASSPENLKATTTLEFASALSAQNGAQDKRYLRRVDDKAAIAEEERFSIMNFESVMEKQNYSTILGNILKRRYIPSFKYLPAGSKLESYFLSRALRKAYPDVRVNPKEWSTEPYFTHFLEQKISTKKVRESMGSGKTVDRFVLSYAMWIDHHEFISIEDKLELLSMKKVKR